MLEGCDGFDGGEKAEGQRGILSLFHEEERRVLLSGGLMNEMTLSKERKEGRKKEKRRTVSFSGCYCSDRYLLGR